MAHEPVRLIVCDLDGTLLSSDHVVTPTTEQAIRAAMDSGVLFTVATGKTYTSTPELIRQFNIQIPVICGNGTEVYAPDGTILYEDLIPRDVAVEAVAFAREHDLLPVIYAGPQLLAPLHDANVEELVAHHEPVPVIVPALEDALRREYKPSKLILMNQDPARMDAAHRILGEHFAGRALALRSGLPSVVELMPLGVTKGTAMAVLLDHVGVTAAQTLAMGDNFNDLDMIKQAGIGVAMAHAPEPVRRQADYVTGTNDEDGVGQAIHRFVLNGHQ